MKEYLTFADVLLLPNYSTVKSRKDVDPRTELFGRKFLPIISANMDTITEEAMANAMANGGAVGCLHRFWSIEKNCIAYIQSPKHTWVSVGIGPEELKRAEVLVELGAEVLVLDVAHGSTSEVVNQV